MLNSLFTSPANVSPGEILPKLKLSVTEIFALFSDIALSATDILAMLRLSPTDKITAFSDIKLSLPPRLHRR